MLISVLIPLEFHRDQATEAIGKWRREQTIDPTRFELIVIASRRSKPADLSAIRALLGAQDRLILTDAAHDVAQVAEAATHSRADFLFFTESHVVPTPMVLEQCCEVFKQHPEWAGFSCRTRGITPNRLARAEARMYEADIKYGMTSHPWRKILDQCFVTRRAAYELTGGFDGSLGHFAEYLLAAQYAALNLPIGYAPGIELSHYYIGHVPTLREFTQDFVAGEMAYWQRGEPRPAERLMEAPIEWWSRGDRRRDLALNLLKIARRHHRAAAGVEFSREDLHATYRRHGIAALFGGGATRCAARLDLVRRRVSLACARIVESEDQLHDALRCYISALARVGRVCSVPAAERSNSSAVLWSPGPDDAHRSCGFHAGEVFENVPFRWSREVAVIELTLPPGVHRLRIHTLLSRLTTTAAVPAFYFNGRRIKDEKVLRDDGHFEFEVKPREGEGAMLGWVTGLQPAPGDARHLGLPVTDISLLPAKKVKSAVRAIDTANV